MISQNLAKKDLKNLLPRRLEEQEEEIISEELLQGLWLEVTKDFIES